MENLSSILIMLVVLFILARLGSRIFTKFGVPGLIGEIIIGIVVANTAIAGWLDIDMLNGSENHSIIELFAELGVIFLLFSVGLETKVKDLMSVGKAAMLVAILGVIIPFVLGFIYIDLMDGKTVEAMFMGAAMVATSVGITARVIKDMKLMDAHESRIIIGAAVIDDVLGLIVLAVVSGMAGDGGFSISSVLTTAILAVVFVLVVLAIAKWIIPRVSTYFDERHRKIVEKTGENHVTVNKLVLAIVVCLGMAWMAESLGLAAIIGAFLGGMLLANHAWEWELESKIETIQTFFLSFFFLNVGMQINVESCLNVTVLAMAAVLIVLAVISKYIGCSLGARLGDKTLDKDSRSIIGIGMIPRGEVGIIVATMGLSAGVLSDELYAVVVMMAVATTIIAPPLLAKAYRKKYPEEYKITPNDL